MMRSLLAAIKLQESRQTAHVSRVCAEYAAIVTQFPPPDIGPSPTLAPPCEITVVDIYPLIRVTA